MKKYAIVKQTHLYNKTKNTMYQGSIEVDTKDSVLSLAYVESDGKTQVLIEADIDQLHIHRLGEIESYLSYETNAKTKGVLKSEFGDIEVEIVTHKYIRKENCIALEYDIVQNDEVIDGYRILWNIKEE